jgi:hypothetical protein
MPSEDAGGHGVDGLAVGDVAELHLAAELVRQCPKPLLAARDEDAVPFLAREQPRDRLADARRRAGYDGDAAAT